jgi:hypothetical protein
MILKKKSKRQILLCNHSSQKLEKKKKKKKATHKISSPLSGLSFKLVVHYSGFFQKTKMTLL